MHVVNVHEVPHQWGLLMQQAEAGGTIVIVERGRPRAVLSPYPGTRASPAGDATDALPRWTGDVVGSLRRHDLYDPDD